MSNTTTYFPNGIGVKILLDSGKIIQVLSLHLDWSSYGPYAANNRQTTKIEQIMAGENSGRRAQIIRMFNQPLMKKWMLETNEVPIFICGDFNAPSHLDWTDETRKIHGGWQVKWPATRELESRGFVDSYRYVHPNVLKNPGITWSTVYKFNPEWKYTIPEPQDRIDFIFYKGPMTAVKSGTYCGDGKLDRIPYHRRNDYPSDHFAVYTDFKFAN